MPDISILIAAWQSVLDTEPLEPGEFKRVLIVETIRALVELKKLKGE